MSTSHTVQPCAWPCRWQHTRMCAQCLLNSQSLADHRVTLGVLCGLKALYEAHGLPQCIHGNRVNWTGEDETDDVGVSLEAAVAL